jgi:Ca-activated chloride channel family protein
MSFSSPILLLTLLLVPTIVAGHVWLERRRESRAADWAPLVLLPNMVDRPPSWRRHAPVALLLAGLALLLVGFARPHATVSVKKRNAVVVLVLDVSGSMAAGDSKPTRLGVAKAVAGRFLEALPHGYSVAVETFSDHAAVVAPPSSDPVRADIAIGHARSGPQGTALAEAVWHAVDVAHSVPADSHGKRPPAAIVVLSDGGQTAGRITPKQAVTKAQKAHIPVSAVAIGTPDGVVEQKLAGGLAERIQVPLEPTLLQGFARQTGGQFFSGAGGADVQRVYSLLGSRLGHRRKNVEISSAAAGGGLVFMVAGALLSGLWFRRLV